MNITIPMLALTPHGGGRVLVEIANALARRGDMVKVIVSNYRGSMPFVFDERVQVKKIGPESSSKLLCLISFLMLSPFYLAGSNIIANHFLTVPPSWVAQALGGKYIYLVQDIEHRFFTRPSQWPLRVLCNWTYRRGRLVAANAYLAGQLSVYNQVLLTLRLGVSRIFFAHPAAEAVKRFDVVYFLRAQPHKRLDRFTSILRQLAAKKIKVLCISQDKVLLEAFEGQAETLMPANDTQLVDAIDSGKIMLLTSEHEGFALPPLEGMARGLPAVMYECGGPGVYSTDGVNAFIVPGDGDEDLSAFAVVERIERLLQSDTLLKDMSASARRVAADFRLDQAVDDFVIYLARYFHDKR